MGITLLTKFLGLAYQVIVVNTLGLAHYDLALFDTASVIPDMLSTILLIGSISAAVVPVLSYVRANKGEEKFYQTFVEGLKIFFLLFSVFAFFVILFTPNIMNLVLDWTVKTNNPFDDIEKFNELVLFVRLLILPQVILGVSAFFIAGLNSIKKFIIPQLTGLFYNLGQILGVVAIIPIFHVRPIWGIVIGTFLASIFHLVIQIPILRNTEYWSHIKREVFSLNFIFMDENGYSPAYQMIRLSIPKILSSGIEFVMNKYFVLYALFLGIVAQQRYYYASSLMMIPFSMFVQSFVVVAFPTMSKSFADGDREEFQNVFQKTVNKILFYVVPVTMIFLILRIPIVRITFGMYPGRGLFTWEDTIAIAYILFFFSIGLIPDVINVVISRVYFAAQNTALSLIVNIFLVVLSVFFAQFFTSYFSHFASLNFEDIKLNFEYVFSPDTFTPNTAAQVGGIAFGISLANIVIFFVNCIVLNYKYFKLSSSDFWIKLLNKLVAGAIMALFMYVIAKFWEINVETTTVLGLIISTFGTVSFGLFGYIFASLLLKVEEVYYIKSKFSELLYV